MLRKKQLKLLTTLLVGSLFMHNASAMNWVPSMSDVTSSASYLLSRIEPERWSSMTLQNQKAVVVLVATLVLAAVAFMWKYKSSVSNRLPENDTLVKNLVPQVEVSSSNLVPQVEVPSSTELLNEQNGAIGELTQDIKLVAHSIAAVTKPLNQSRMEYFQKEIEKLGNTIDSYEWMPKEVKDELNTQLKQMRQALQVASGILAQEIAMLIKFFNEKISRSSLSSQEKQDFNKNIQSFIDIISGYIKNYGQIDSNLEQLRQDLLDIQALLAHAGA